MWQLGSGELPHFCHFAGKLKICLGRFMPQENLCLRKQAADVENWIREAFRNFATLGVDFHFSYGRNATWRLEATDKSRTYSKLGSGDLQHFCHFRGRLPSFLGREKPQGDLRLGRQALGVTAGFGRLPAKLAICWGAHRFEKPQI